MSDKFTVTDFFTSFPDDDACLKHIMDVRFGERHECEHCGKETSFHKITKRRAYVCAHCGVHVFPCAGTIFENSRTSLQIWFYAIFLFVVTRHGVSGKELQRQLGVTYKTAWRMGKQIRELMTSCNTADMLWGHVEVDEAYVGGKRRGVRGRGAAGKTIVVGIKQRDGDLQTEVVQNVRKVTLREVVNRRVEKGTIVSTDEMLSYGLLERDGYKHGTAKHSAKQWAYYDQRHGVLHHTNSVEGFWRLFKASVRSTHIHISPKYMDRYLGEFTFRSNYRQMENAMFDLLIGAV